ncbi:MAG TPA: ComEC/Rec2 family competence protein [Beijerinckiaceae bacterium]|nr:ComEC/Rec2 family competence protein [Beijerinckiaceae bacterium]
METAAESGTRAGTSVGETGRAAPFFVGHLLGLAQERLAAALQREIDERRLALWVPVAAGAGVVLYFNAEREPSLWFTFIVFAFAAAGAVFVRERPVVFSATIVVAAIFGGLLSGGLRSARVAAPVLDRIRIVELTGFIEEMDVRRIGARFVLRVASAEGLDPALTPERVRLTIRQAPQAAAGDFVIVKARLMPPAHAVLPGGYDFARDAYFAGLGAVGNVLGRVETMNPPDPPDLALRIFAAIDRGRNLLEARVNSIVGGEAGAVAAAMVTGKRDLLDDETMDTIREAGIFHVITISGVQMTLVAGIFFWTLRALLATSRTLALHYPIKKWAAAMAMVGAVAYDMATGSRIGTERALVMTLILLGAILVDRQALTMRNLAVAALVVIVIWPEAILGASFQLSFAAVAGLIAVHETKAARRLSARRPDWPQRQLAPDRKDRLLDILDRLRRGPGGIILATACASAATASFMANDFHELSPYVLVGNPLTLALIEFFAVPAALVGTLLYPLGLDAWVWHGLGFGIDVVLFLARLVAAAPAATTHVDQFAPWAIIFLTLAVLSAVIWRSALLRLTAVPFALIGIAGAMAGEHFDIAVPPDGDSVAVRLATGRFAILAARPELFDAEQWLTAVGDARTPAEAIITARKPATDSKAPRCDRLGCAATLADGRTLSLVLDAEAFIDDCTRADIVVTPLFAPSSCGAELVVDRRRLETSGAVTLTLDEERIVTRTARAVDEDRPWSKKPAFAVPPRRVSEGQSPSSVADDARIDAWQNAPIDP